MNTSSLHTLVFWKSLWFKKYLNATGDFSRFIEINSQWKSFDIFIPYVPNVHWYMAVTKKLNSRYFCTFSLFAHKISFWSHNCIKIYINGLIYHCQICAVIKLILIKLYSIIFMNCSFGIRLKAIEITEVVYVQLQKSTKPKLWQTSEPQSYSNYKIRKLVVLVFAILKKCVIFAISTEAPYLFTLPTKDCRCAYRQREWVFYANVKKNIIKVFM